MDKIQEMIDILNEIKEKKSRQKEGKKTRLGKLLVGVFAVIGVAASVAGIAYAVYRFLTPNYLEDFNDDDFEDDFDDYFEDEDKKSDEETEDKKDKD